jgi:hypothetical protein
MKRFVIFSALLLSMTMVAQEAKYKVENNMVVSINPQTINIEPIKTGWFYDEKGFLNPVYKNSKGKYYIVKLSKKTGKQYKRYLTIKI